jgi:nitrite reductase/ring-hydroxylating ferredoxin subunit
MSATPSAGLPKGTMWVQVARLDQVVPGTVRRVDALGSKVALVSVGADLYALDDECPHAGGPLADGELDGLVLTCPHHGFSFDVRNGDCTSGAAAKATPRRVKVEGELVLVEVPDA